MALKEYKPGTTFTGVIRRTTRVAQYKAALAAA
jgi:hypothetical protein